MKPILFTNGLIFNDGFRFIGTIKVAGGIIQHVGCGRIDTSEINPEEYDIVDCEGKMVFPGVIDEHVHFRDPGMTEKGDIATESRAAVAGGVTSFFDMPNTIPATTTLEAWEEKLHLAAESSVANYAFFLGVTNDNIDQILAADATRLPGVKLFLGSSTGNMLVDNDSTISTLFRNFRGVIACHAESEQHIAEARKKLSAEYPDGIPVGLHHLVRSRQGCIAASSHAISLARETGARLHLLHITTADELDNLLPGSVQNKRITAETCPHYLMFDQESVGRTGGLTKCNPAIKTDDDRKALLHAVNDGRIDIIASDHAPHLRSQKQGNALTAASGMPSVQYTFPLMLQLAREGHFTYERVVEKMCNNPALLYGVDRRGFIRIHYWADLVIVNPDACEVIKNSDVISSCGWTPYADTTLNFKVEQTWVNGRLAYDSRRPDPFTGLETALPIRFNPF
ncbi:MAG: dihydroorotase [Muribaculaceae bacterium]|nr:dihydroorotase [Muribaculaceae bacterium]